LDEEPPEPWNVVPQEPRAELAQELDEEETRYHRDAMVCRASGQQGQPQVSREPDPDSVYQLQVPPV